MMVVRFLAALGIVLSAGPAWAQGEVNGAFAGTVRNSTGSVLPGVIVEASGPALVENARWPQSTDVLSGRLFKFGADIEF